MWSVVTHGIFGDVSTDEPKENGYYILKFTSNPYILQEYVIIDGRIIVIGE